MAAGAYIAFVGGQQLLALRRARWRIPGESVARSMGGYAMAAVGIVTGIAGGFGAGPGLYAIAVVVVAIILWSLWNALTLVMGVADEEIEAESAHPGAPG